MPPAPSVSPVAISDGSDSCHILFWRLCAKKLLWYMMSTNRELILSEIRFKFVKLVTDTYEFSIRNEMPSADRGLKKALLLYKEVDGIVYEKEIMYEHGGLLADGAREAFTELNHRADLRAEETVFSRLFVELKEGLLLKVCGECHMDILQPVH